LLWAGGSRNPSCNLPRPSFRPSHSVTTLFSASLSMLAVLLTPVAVLTGALGVWRLGADPGWTNQFFIANGLLSHWQAWFAVAIGVHTSARSLNRWLEIQNSGARNVAGRREASRAITPESETPASVVCRFQLSEIASAARIRSQLGCHSPRDRSSLALTPGIARQ
jgi:hypothetical protein